MSYTGWDETFVVRRGQWRACTLMIAEVAMLPAPETLRVELASMQNHNHSYHGT